MSILTEAGIKVKRSWFKALSFCIITAALSNLLLSGLTPPDAYGALGQINIRLTGMVVALGCTVDPNDVNKPVQLGEWATRHLKKTGQTTSPVPFTILLTGCTASGVTTRFTGAKDTLNPELLSLKSDDKSYAFGIAVQIMDSKGQRIPMGSNAPRGVVDERGNVTLSFLANYVVTGNDSVKPGTADADTEFTLSYD